MVASAEEPVNGARIALDRGSIGGGGTGWSARAPRAIERGGVPRRTPRPSSVRVQTRLGSA